MPGKYAVNTNVTSDRSRSEIESILQKYGATGFLYGWQEKSAMIAFQMKNKHIRFLLPMPDRKSPEFTKTETGRKRADKSSQDAYDQSVKQKWRALALNIKAKLEAVEIGLASFEHEFGMNIVLPNGQIVSDFIQPQIEKAYETGNMPPLLELYKGDDV